MNDLISKQDALELVRDVCDAIMSCCGSHYDEETKDEVYDDIREVDAILKCNKEIRIALKNMPSAQPEVTLLYAAKTVLEFVESCGGTTTRLVTPEGDELSCDWGYVEEGMRELIRYAERREE